MNPYTVEVAGEEKLAWFYIYLQTEMQDYS